MCNTGCVPGVLRIGLLGGVGEGTLFHSGAVHSSPAKAVRIGRTRRR